MVDELSTINSGTPSEFSDDEIGRRDALDQSARPNLAQGTLNEDSDLDNMDGL